MVPKEYDIIHKKEGRHLQKFLEISIKSCFECRRATKSTLQENGRLFTDDIVDDKMVRVGPSMNVTKVLSRLEVLTAFKGALTPSFSSSILRRAMSTDTWDRNIHKSQIEVALAVLSATLHDNKYPDDKTCELLAKRLMKNGYTRISAKLFEYLRHQCHFCSLASYKAWISYLVYQASQAEIEYFGDSVDIIDHVHDMVQRSYVTARGNTKASFCSYPRLLAEHMLLQAANTGCELDRETQLRLQTYTPMGT